MPYFQCPECGLTLKRHPQLAAIDDLCPRCRATGRSPVALAVLALAGHRHGGRQGPGEAVDHHLLTLRGEHLDALTTITLWGELDVASAATLEAEVMVAERNGAVAIMLDLSGLEFVDSAGLHAILACERRCRSRGVALSLLRGPAQVQRLFELTRTSERLAFLD